MSFLDRLRDPRPLLAVELRPPRRDRSARDSMESWIDTYHGVRRVLDRDTLVMLTDSAVGQREEESLLHLMSNLGADADVSRIAPILTCKHSLEYCSRFPLRAAEHGHRALVVLGGDRHDGVPRCVEHAYLLRQRMRLRQPALALGGWANPHSDAGRQVGYLLAEEMTADFYLTQIVSHYDLGPVDAFLEEVSRQGLEIPGLFGVFFYRSARRATLDALQPFFPIPRDGLERDLARGALGPVEVCARTIAALHARGVSRVYISNLVPSRARETLDVIAERVAQLESEAVA